MMSFELSRYEHCALKISGLGKLASVYQETPTFGGAGTVDDVSTQIAHVSPRFKFEFKLPLRAIIFIHFSEER